LGFKRLGVEIPIVGGDIDSRAYIAAAAIDGKTQVDVRGAFSFLSLSVPSPESSSVGILQKKLQI
jgi:hypothetical protein